MSTREKKADKVADLPVRKVERDKAERIKGGGGVTIDFARKPSHEPLLPCI